MMVRILICCGLVKYLIAGKILLDSSIRHLTCLFYSAAYLPVILKADIILNVALRFIQTFLHFEIILLVDATSLKLGYL